MKIVSADGAEATMTVGAALEEAAQSQGDEERGRGEADEDNRPERGGQEEAGVGEAVGGEAGGDPLLVIEIEPAEAPAIGADDVNAGRVFVEAVYEASCVAGAFVPATIEHG
jgi:hypothetical protein